MLRLNRGFWAISGFRYPGIVVGTGIHPHEYRVDIDKLLGRSPSIFSRKHWEEGAGGLEEQKMLHPWNINSVVTGTRLA